MMPRPRKKKEVVNYGTVKKQQSPVQSSTQSQEPIIAQREGQTRQGSRSPMTVHNTVQNKSLEKVQPSAVQHTEGRGRQNDIQIPQIETSRSKRDKKKLGFKVNIETNQSQISTIRKSDGESSHSNKAKHVANLNQSNMKNIKIKPPTGSKVQNKSLKQDDFRRLKSKESNNKSFKGFEDYQSKKLRQNSANSYKDFQSYQKQKGTTLPDIKNKRNQQKIRLTSKIRKSQESLNMSIRSGSSRKSRMSLSKKKQSQTNLLTYNDNNRSRISMTGDKSYLQNKNKKTSLKRDYLMGSCPFCLKSRCFVIELDCMHGYCTSCCSNLMKITKIKKGFQYFLQAGEECIKCPKCQQITQMGPTLLNLISEIKEYEDLRVFQMEKNKEAIKSNLNTPPCQLCPQQDEKPPFPAQFECLNCESTLLCYNCRVKHSRNQRYKDHKIVKYDGQTTIQKAENLLCDEHHEKFKIYCFTDDKAICLTCAQNTNPKHQGHFVKSLHQVLEQAEKEKSKLHEEIYDQLGKMDAAVQYFNGLEEFFIGQKTLYIKKLNADFEVIYKLVERKHSELKDKIENVYDKFLKEAYQYVEGLQAMKDTVEQIQKSEIKLDIEQIQLNKNMMQRIKEIEKELDFDMQGQELDLIESRFICEPFKRIEKSLITFDFQPITQKQMIDLEGMFLSDGHSRIITKEMLTPDFLLIMPPRMRRAELIYQHSTEMTAMALENNLKSEPSANMKSNKPQDNITQQNQQNPNNEIQTGPQRFHIKCDNRGPTLIIIKANEGHVFGGFNPTSWVSEFMYSECDDAYLFSITDGQGRKPIKCPVKPEKKDKAIKQNDKHYSPSFGEANISDLFIAFKNLTNSYSMLGNVFKLPKGQRGETFLAGRHNDWKVDEVEVWSITY